jgi:hypothetical protein
MAARGEVWKCGYVEKLVDNIQKDGKKGLKKGDLWITRRPVDIFSGTLGKRGTKSGRPRLCFTRRNPG